MTEGTPFSNTNPETFYDIQEEKTANLLYLMGILVALYCSFFWAAYVVFRLGIRLRSPEVAEHVIGWGGSRYALGFGVLTAVVHFFVAFTRDIRPELARLGVKEPDPEDQYHRVFSNVLEEMKVATGRTDIRGYVLPTRYRTALSLEDRSNAAVIVTEGALGVLDRNEIQAVVAHEVAHVAYGDTALKTFVHKMVSFVDALNADSFENRSTDWGYRSYRSGKGSVGHIGVVMVSYAYECLLRLLSTTISKERERRADATAVEYNRNPLALAGALHKLGSYYRQSSLDVGQYRGSRYLRKSDFDSLQVVPVNASLNRDSFFDNLFNTHPPLEERLNTLLDLAGTPRENLENAIEQETTESFETNCVRAEDGEPIVEKSFWTEKKGEASGPHSFSELLADELFGPRTKIGLSPDGPMQSMQSLPLFQYLFELVDQGKLNRDCPECGGPLLSDDYLGVPLETCPICGGVGVQSDRMLRVVCRYQKGNNNAPGDVKGFSHPPAYDQEPEEDFELKQPCPECAGDFEKSFYTGLSSLIVDTCKKCGFVWFENGELQVACEVA